MKKIPAILAAAMLCLTACDQPRSATDEIADASTAIADADYHRAGAICRQVLQDYQLSEISTADLCGMAVMLIKVSEHADSEDNAAAAVKCYHYVMEHTPDSASACWGQLPSEDFQYVFLLNNLDTSLSAAADHTDIPEE